ncbi:MAG: hypothetical protein KGQ41_05555 [Alphaproteobacteria bacterium]|nr:hypothetical protein [Alphaproteobacteria bacterium]
MVGSVQAASGSTAYIKGAQLGSGSSANLKRVKSEESSAKLESAAAELKEKIRSTDSKDSVTKTAASTELTSRNETEVIKTEQTRGSLLDLAV